MKTSVDDELRRDAVRFRFRFGCEHCAHLDPDKQSCAEGYPNGDHVRIDLEQEQALYFCKAFELE